MVVRHVLLDADGVVQNGAGDVPALLAAHLGEGAIELLTAVLPDDSPVLLGEVELVPVLRDAVGAAGKDVDVQRLYDEVWLAIEVHEPTMALVARLRAQGYGVHLGTNQDPARARHMRATLGYDQAFDTCFYSCELGVAKPSGAFFEAVLERVGARPDEVLFLDDSERYVAGARAAGLPAEQWSTGDGDERLLKILERHGVRVA
ncbi:HAD family hydrolase [Nocardioides sp. SYSU DS0651]|uniref:HAD family hydrolase n=1 Tax=Nocardioides sp. SYSU DS0651 TaxID=3415955 RepID=UPI003F4C8EBA